MRPESGFRMATNWPEIGKNTITSQFADMASSSSFYGVTLFLLSNLVTGPIFMSILWLVLKLSRFSFIKDWLQMRKLQIHPSEFCPLPVYWRELGIPNLTFNDLNSNNFSLYVLEENVKRYLYDKNKYDNFSLIHVNIKSMNSNFEKLHDILLNCSHSLNIICVTKISQIRTLRIIQFSIYRTLILCIKKKKNSQQRECPSNIFKEWYKI